MAKKSSVRIQHSKINKVSYEIRCFSGSYRNGDILFYKKLNE